MSLNKTKKFWDFKDTKSHKKLSKGFISPDVIRMITFEKSFLLEVYSDDSKSTHFVIPLKFQSNYWPRGFYTGVSEKGKMFFSEKDIVRVIGEI
jgi:hypothetical protein